MAYTPINLGDGISREPLGSALKKIDTMLSELYVTVPEGDFSAVSQNIVPGTDLTYNLGSPTNRWHSLYVGTGSIYIGDAKLSATTTGQIILPGVYDPTNHQAITVVSKSGVGQDRTWGAPETVFIIDNFTYQTLSGALSAPGGWIRAQYAATLNEEGYISGASVTNGGNEYSDIEINGVANVATVSEDFMWAYDEPFNIGDPNPLSPFDPERWFRIPFSVESQATNVNLSTTIGENVSYNDLLDLPDQSLNTTSNVEFNSLTTENIYAPAVSVFNISTIDESETIYNWQFAEDGSTVFPSGLVQQQESFTSVNNNEIRFNNGGALELIGYTSAVSIVSDLDNGGNYWTFETDGGLTLPPGGTIEFDNGTLAVGSYTRVANDPFAINVSDTAGAINLNWGVTHGLYSNKVTVDQYGVTLTTNTSKTFEFGTDGSVTLPLNSYIRSDKTDLSEGRVGWHEFLAGPTIGWGLYAQHDIYIQADNISTKPTWIFRKNGTLQTPYFTFPASDGANGQVLVTNGSGVLSWSTPASGGANLSTSSINELADVTVNSPVVGQVLKWNGSAWVNDTDATGGGGGGGGTLSTRTTRSVTTGSLANNASANATITGFSAYALLSIQTSAAAWVTVYTSTAARTSDSSRTITDDPVPGSGVLAEVITTGAQTQIFTPAVFGFNDEAIPTTDVYIKVVNRSGSTTAITVTLKLLQLEA